MNGTAIANRLQNSFKIKDNNLPMGEKHPPPKEAEPEPVEYFSQLSATNEDCLIFCYISF
jgi:hypothetical protein